MPIFHKVIIVYYISRGFDSMPIVHKVMTVCLYFSRL